MENTLEMRLKQLIKENVVTLMEDADINDETDLIQDLGFDSVSIIRTIVDIEAAFDIEIDDEFLVAEILSKFGKLKDCVELHLKRAGRLS